MWHGSAHATVACAGPARGCRGPRHGGRRHSGLRAGHDDRRGSGVILGPASAHVDASRGPRHDRRRGADHRVRDGPQPPQGGDRQGERGRPGGAHACLRRVDDRRPGNHRHARPQRCRGDLLRVHAAPAARRRGPGPPRRPGLHLGPGGPARRRGHPRPARADDVGVRGLRDRQRTVRGRPLRGPVPAVDPRGAARLRDRQAAVLPAGHELELRAHQLRDPRPRAGTDHRPTDARGAEGEGARAPGARRHDRPGDAGDPGAGAARVHLRTAGGARDPRRHPVLRGVDVLEPVVDDHPRRHPDHDDRGPPRHRRRHRHRSATVRGVLPGDGLHRPAGAHHRAARLRHVPPAAGRVQLRTGDRDVRRLAGAEPAVLRGVRGVRLPAVGPRRHRAGRDLRREGLRPGDGAYANQADALWREIGAVLVPADPPPTKR